MRYSPDGIRTPLPACWGCHEAFTALQLTFYFPAGSSEVWMCLLHCVNGIAQDLDCGAPPGPPGGAEPGPAPGFPAPACELTRLPFADGQVSSGLDQSALGRSHSGSLLSLSLTFGKV